MQSQPTATEYRSRLARRILEAAAHEFRLHGVRQVRMDDIATALSISKRTLYEIYSCKEELLLATVKEQFADFDHHMAVYAREHPNVIDIFIETYRHEMRSVSATNPAYLSEVQRYPGVVEWLRRNAAERLADNMRYFQLGMEQGLFRADIDYGLISELINATMNYTMGSDLQSRYPQGHLFRNVALVYLRGICTAKGLELLERQMPL